MNIRKQNADEHTVMGYASACVCAVAVTLCACSTTTCECSCISLGGGETNTATTHQMLDASWNSDLKNHSSNSTQSKAIR